MPTGQRKLAGLYNFNIFFIKRSVLIFKKDSQFKRFKRKKLSQQKNNHLMFSRFGLLTVSERNFVMSE